MIIVLWCAVSVLFVGYVESKVPCYKDKKYNYTHPEHVHPESPLAHALLDGLCGVEIGAASYAPFGLNTVNAGLTEEMDAHDYKKYRDHQIAVTGDYARIDIPASADNLSAIADSSVDFVINSHVWEHLPNPLKALEEWVRIVRNNGLLFIMVPHRTALSSDVGREVTTIEKMARIYNGLSVANADSHRGHYHVFSVHLLLSIQHWFNAMPVNRIKQQHLELVTVLEMDDKIRLGHQVSKGHYNRLHAVGCNPIQPHDISPPIEISASSFTHPLHLCSSR
jgi:SAM-dependent methyltransferase